jgi:hypothetical protein
MDITTILNGERPMKTTTRWAVLGFGLAALIGMAGTASADTAWQKHHPRREEVNARLIRQSHRITTERREGELSRAQAHDLRVQDKGIRAQERFDASKHGSHLTKAEQHKLNREENGVSRQIGK